MTQRGDQTAQRIVDKALSLALREGLDRFSLNAVATGVGIAKSSILVHFAHKEALQVAIVEEAEARFRRAVVEPASRLQGLERLRALLLGCAEEAARELADGHAFLTRQVYAFGTAKPGHVHDRLVAFRLAWRRELRAGLEEARVDVDVDSLDAILGGLIGAIRCELQQRGPAAARARGVTAIGDLVRHFALS